MKLYLLKKNISNIYIKMHITKLNKILNYIIKFIDQETMNQLRMCSKHINIGKQYFESVFYNYIKCMQNYNKYECTPFVRHINKYKLVNIKLKNVSSLSQIEKFKKYIFEYWHLARQSCVRHVSHAYIKKNITTILFNKSFNEIEKDLFDCIIGLQSYKVIT